MSNSKNKGGNWERKFSKELSLWWSNGERDDIYWHTHGSGSRATNRAKKGKTSINYGDILAEDSTGQPLLDIFVIELKKGYNKSNILDEVDTASDSHPFRKNLDQVIRDSIAANKEPLLIFHRDRKKPCVCFYKTRFLKMTDFFGGLPPKSPMIILDDGFFDFVIFKLEDFFNWAKPEYFTSRLLNVT